MIYKNEKNKCFECKNLILPEDQFKYLHDSCYTCIFCGHLGFVDNFKYGVLSYSFLFKDVK